MTNEELGKLLEELKQRLSQIGIAQARIEEIAAIIEADSENEKKTTADP